MSRFEIACGLVIASVASTTVHAAMVDIVGINRAFTAAVTGDTSNGTLGAVKDQIRPNQYDSTAAATSAVALTFGSEQSFNKMFLYMTEGFVIPGFEVQKAKSGVLSPNVNNNSDWETISGGSFSGLPSNGQNVFTFTQNLVSGGVRILTTDKSTPGLGNTMRIREWLVFDRYNNVAPLATASYSSGDGWTGAASQVNNELISDQSYFDDDPNPGAVDFTWTTPVDIGSFLVFGGAGAANEHLIDFTISADLGGGLQTLFTHTGNTDKVTHDILTNRITTDHVRITITSADSDGLARISEVFMFVPEPSSLTLASFGLAGMVFARRRSLRRHVRGLQL